MKQANIVAPNLQRELDVLHGTHEPVRIFVFDGKTTTDNVITMAECMQGDHKAPQVVITTSTIAVGVNIYGRCFVLMLEEPVSLASFQQGLGRSCRPAGGPIHVAFPAARGEKFDPEVLHGILLNKFLSGK